MYRRIITRNEKKQHARGRAKEVCRVRKQRKAEISPCSINQKVLTGHINRVVVNCPHD